jgi:dTDP-L-rhamnose 4-epimerase
LANVLITGGAGFIGSNLARRLTNQGWRVTVLDILSQQIHGSTPENSNLFLSLAGIHRFIRGDILRRDILEDALEEQDAVIHLAAETGTGQSMYLIDRYAQVNIGGTALLLDILANKPHKVRRVLIASSRAIYGEGKYHSEKLGDVYPQPRLPHDMEMGDFEPKVEGGGALKLLPTDEGSCIHPSSVYGITKQVQEQLAMTVTAAMGIEGVALRYQNVYGPGQSLSNPYTGILSIFSNLIMSGKSINIFEDGKESRDFVYIDDVVDASVTALTHPAAAGNVFNIGFGSPIDVLTVARTLVDRLGRVVPIEISGNFRTGDIRHNFACMKKADRLMGFRPKIDFETGITRFCEWAAVEGPKNSDYAGSIREMKAKGFLK